MISLIGAIAEVLDALPVFFKRIGIRQGIGVVIFWMAVGKTLGVWMWYFILT